MNPDIEETEEDEVTRDADGNELVSGDTVQLTRDLNVKGTKLSLRKGTVVKNIRLTSDPEEIECRVDDMKGIILRTEFLRKKS